MAARRTLFFLKLLPNPIQIGCPKMLSFNREPTSRDDTLNDREITGPELDRRIKLTGVIAAIAFIPIVVISALGQHYAALLNGLIPVELTNFQALLSMLSGAFHLRDHGDSWVPMLAALRTLHGSSGEEIYKSLFMAYGVPLLHPAAAALNSTAEGIYNTLFFSFGIRFQYPPMSLLSLDALSVLGSPGRSELTCLNFTVFCLNAVGCGSLALTLFRPSTDGANPSFPAPNPLGMAVLVFIAAFVFYPLVRAPVLGQIQVWIDALFTGSLLCWLHSRRFFAGILIGLACAIKPQLGMLLIWGLLWREISFSSGILTALIPLTAVSLWRYGWQNHLAYLDVLAFLGRHGEIYFANNSVNGILNAYLSGRNNMVFDLPGELPDVPLVYWGTLATSILVLGLVVVPPLWRRGRRPDIADLSAAAICTVVGSPVAWEHHYGILLPIYLVALKMVLAIGNSHRRLVAILALAVSWALVANFIPFAHLLASTPFRIVQAHCFFGAVLLLAQLFMLNRDGEVHAAGLADSHGAQPRPVAGSDVLGQPA